MARKKSKGTEIPKDLSKRECKKLPTPKQKRELRILKQNVRNLYQKGSINLKNHNSFFPIINDAIDGHCCCINLDAEIAKIRKQIIKTAGEYCVDDNVEIADYL